MSRFVISCGGTGGHLSPGIALAEALRDKGHESVLLISRKQVDARLSEKYPHLRFERMPGSGLSWHPVRLARFIGAQLRALWFCLRLVRKLRPQAVVGFGGFTSAPAALAARLCGVPCALHESNRVPGRAIRALGRLATRVYLPPGIRIDGVRLGATRHVGLPVRREIAALPQEVARRALGLDPARRTLVILGGSQGASALNEWARESFEGFAAEEIQMVVVTGPGKGGADIIEGRGRSGAPVRGVFMPFCDRMAELMSAADLVVSRAGAGTLAELTRCGIPAVLVPYPQAADDHQRANAEYFEREGGGVVVPQAGMAKLTATVRALLADERLLKQTRDNLRRMDRANAVDLMIADIEEMTGAARGEVRMSAMLA